MGLLERFLVTAGLPGEDLRFCAGCRMLLGGGEPVCAVCRSPPVAARTPRELLALLTIRAAGSPTLREIMSGLAGELLAAVAFPIGIVLRRRAVETSRPSEWRYQRIRHDVVCSGVAEDVGVDGAREVVLGRVVGSAPVVVAAEHRLCVDDARAPILLRRGATGGFAVELDDRRLVVIPPGAARCVAIARRARRLGEGRLPVARVDARHEVVEIRGVDRVGVQGEVVAAPAAEVPRDYREAGRPEFRVNGPTIVRLFPD